MNCGGYDVHYSVVRSIAVNGGIYFTLTNSAGSTYGAKTTSIGVTTHPSSGGAYDQGKTTLDLQSDPIYPSSARILPSGYLIGTQFTMYGSMSASNGVCDNIYGGNLSY